MRKTEFTYKSSNEKTDIRAVLWLPDGEIKAVLQIAHGITEHILRYEDIALYLTANSIAVVGNDHIGHGLSINNDTIPMYFGPCGSWNYVVKDVIKLKYLVQEKIGEYPTFILGFSLGSFVVRNILIDYPNIYDKAILIGTGYISHIEAMIAKIMTNKEAKKHGEDKTTKLVKQLAFDTYNKFFKPNDTEFDWLCSDKGELNIYIEDSLSYKTITCGLFRELLQGMDYSCNKNNIKKMNKIVNIIMFSGDKDPVGKEGKGVEKVYQLFKNNGINNCDMKIYSNLRHDILHEINKKVVYGDILSWIEKNY